MADTFKGKEGLLYAGAIGLILSDIIPTPGDALYFHYVKKWRDQWSRGELTSKQYWLREGIGYYTFNSVWWLMVGSVIYFMPGGFEKKLKVGLALAGTGIVVGIFMKNIKDDQENMLAEKNAEKQSLLEAKTA